MERLIFTNANSEQLEFSKTGTYRWTDISDLGAAEAVCQTTASPYQDGRTVVGDSMFMTRIIQIGFIIVSNDVQAAMRELNSVLNPKLGAGTLVYERGGITRMLHKVRTRILPTMPGGRSRGLGFQISSVTIEAFDPFYSDPAESEAEVATGGHALEFPLSISDEFVFDYVNEAGVTVINQGDVKCPVTIILDGPKTAPLEIENMATGEKIVLAMSLLAGERLTITTETDNLNVFKSDIESAAETVAFQYIDVSETTFWQLARGTNTIKITAGGSDVEEATVRFRNRYVGV